MSRTLIGAIPGSLALCAAAPAAVLAAPEQLTVTNLAQPGMESHVPQPPVSIPARGSCATPFSAKQRRLALPARELARARG